MPGLHKSVTCPNAQSQFQRYCTGQKTDHSVGDTARCQRHFASSPSRFQVRKAMALKRPASRPTSQRLDPSTVSRRHTTMSETSRVRRHPTVSETSNPFRIWPSGSRPVFGSLVSRGRLASFCVWRWLSPVWCFRRSCRSFGGFPRCLFLVLALSCFSAFVVRVQFSLSEVNRAGSMD